MNSVNIVGHLTKAPELTETPKGTTITTIRVAINGRSDDDTVYTDVKTFGKHAIACEKYLEKGSRIGVSGRLAFDEWEKDGDKRSRLYVIGNVDFLDRKPGDDAEQRFAPEPEPAAAD